MFVYPTKFHGYLMTLDSRVHISALIYVQHLKAVLWNCCSVCLGRLPKVHSHILLHKKESTRWPFLTTAESEFSQLSQTCERVMAHIHTHCSVDSSVPPLWSQLIKMPLIYTWWHRQANRKSVKQDRTQAVAQPSDSSSECFSICWEFSAVGVQSEVTQSPLLFLMQQCHVSLFF